LSCRGIRTALEMKSLPDALAKRILGTHGLQTIWELRGIPCLAVSPEFKDRKAIVHSRSFSYRVTTLQDLLEAVSEYAARAAEKLRREQAVASYLQVHIATHPYRDEPQYSNAASESLASPTASTPELMRLAQQCLRRIYRPGFRFKRAAVMLSGLEPGPHAQAGLFGREGEEREAALSRTLDRMNTRWGRGTAQYAAEGIRRPWQMKRGKLSAAFTTQWGQLVEARA